MDSRSSCLAYRRRAALASLPLSVLSPGHRLRVCDSSLVVCHGSRPRVLELAAHPTPLAGTRVASAKGTCDSNPVVRCRVSANFQEPLPPSRSPDTRSYGAKSGSVAFETPANAVSRKCDLDIVACIDRQELLVIVRCFVRYRESGSRVHGSNCAS
ncbi:hypothetical protein HPB50_023459 [Hyalomma asiaticum]|uniref:Uncharacterized protein n=1 Tax=Hyalomma asiaticum TaxID=266040 RepID=A0ACB7TQB3_HYAAI|nr:hypothetical protein HPB50_023459 [Hyalomma asiaticum]